MVGVTQTFVEELSCPFLHESPGPWYLANIHLSLSTKPRLYNAYNLSVLLYGRESCARYYYLTTTKRLYPLHQIILLVKYYKFHSRTTRKQGVVVTGGTEGWLARFEKQYF